MKGAFAPDAWATRLCAQIFSLEPVSIWLRDRR
jgi:hypothetical protein